MSIRQRLRARFRHGGPEQLLVTYVLLLLYLGFEVTMTTLGRDELAVIAGFLPVTLVVAALGLTVDYWRAGRRLRRMLGGWASAPLENREE